MPIPRFFLNYFCFPMIFLPIEKGSIEFSSAPCSGHFGVITTIPFQNLKVTQAQKGRDLLIIPYLVHVLFLLCPKI